MLEMNGCDQSRSPNRVGFFNAIEFEDLFLFPRKIKERVEKGKHEIQKNGLPPESEGESTPHPLGFYTSINALILRIYLL